MILNNFNFFKRFIKLALYAKNRIYNPKFWVLCVF